MTTEPRCPVCQITPCEKPTCRYVMALEARLPVVAGVPAGFKLGEGWRQISAPPWAERKLALEHDDGRRLLSADTAWAVKHGALVPIAPPIEVASVPAGFRVVGRSCRCWPPLKPGQRVRNDDTQEMVDHSASQVDLGNWDHGGYSILEPITEPGVPPLEGMRNVAQDWTPPSKPAAPPVAAKLSERERCSKDNCVSYFVAAEERIATLETALDAAKAERDRWHKNYRDTQDALRDIEADLRAQLDAATKEIEALRADRDGHADDARSLQARLNRVNEGAAELKQQITARDARIAGLEASTREDVLKERERCADRMSSLEGLLRRAITYAREDRMKTPGVTRLARVLAEAECDIPLTDAASPRKASE